MRVEGVSWHSGRIYIPDPVLDDDASFLRFLENLQEETRIAVRDVLTANPDHLVMGMSAETFWGGLSGAGAFRQKMKDLSGLDVTTGANACKAALEIHDAKRIGVITPYQPVVDNQVREFFEELGYEVVAMKGLKCKSATSISEVGPEQIRGAFHAVDSPHVDALVQVGTNLPAVRVAAELEHELGKPVLAINAATVWHAYRTNGIDDKIAGFGSLLAEH